MATGLNEATITFADGTVVTAERNGDCFIVDSEPEFPDDLSEVTITQDGAETTLSNAEVIECASTDGNYWFAFREIPEAEIAQETMEAQVMYTALMTDTLIEEG